MDVPAEYICKHCAHAHDSYHDKEWIHIYDLPLGNRKVLWKVERMRILCHCQVGYRVELLSFKNQKHFLTQRYVDYIVLSAQPPHKLGQSLSQKPVEDDASCSQCFLLNS